MINRWKQYDSQKQKPRIVQVERERSARNTEEMKIKRSGDPSDTNNWNGTESSKKHGNETQMSSLTGEVRK